jgi:ligand-binding sensor domain-containing protein
MQSYKHEAGNSSSTSGNSIHAIYRDDKGNMWLSALGSGIDLLNNDGKNFTFYRQSTSDNATSNFGIFSIVEDYNGNILLGTDGGGINILDNRRV